MSIFEKIKFLFKVREPVAQVVAQLPEVKSNWKRVGFWVSLVTSLMALAAAMQGIIPVTAGVALSAALTLLYNILQAFKDADTVGYSPLVKSTKVWMSVLSSVGIFLTALKTGGIDPHWVEVALGGIAGVSMIARDISTNQPETK